MSFKKTLRTVLEKYYRSKDILPVTLHNLLNTEGYQKIKTIKNDGRLLLLDQEAYLLFTLCKKTEKIKGEIAEVGVFSGGSAKLIKEATNKPLHLFDTYEGLPETSDFDNKEQFKKGEYNSSLDSVKDYLKTYNDIYYYKGLVEETANNVSQKKFSLVHLDVDLYSSTKFCLEFFYPRMEKGGIIISHDYTTAQGVKKAFDDFFSNKTEIILEMYATNQCYIVKCGD